MTNDLDIHYLNLRYSEDLCQRVKSATKIVDYYINTNVNRPTEVQALRNICAECSKKENKRRRGTKRHNFSKLTPPEVLWKMDVVFIESMLEKDGSFFDASGIQYSKEHISFGRFFYHYEAIANALRKQGYKWVTKDMVKEAQENKKGKYHAQASKT